MKRSLTLVLLLGLTTVSGCGTLMDTRKQGKTIARRLLGLIAENKPDEIYDTLASPQFRKATERQDVHKMVARFSALGKPKSLSTKNVSFQTSNGVTTGEVKFFVEWPDNTGLLTVQMRKIDDEWKIDYFHVKVDPKEPQPRTQTV